MTNQEFFEKSRKEVKLLNGSTDEAALEAWRAGYNETLAYVRKCLNTYHMDECIDKLEEFSNQELEVINLQALIND